MTLTIKLAKLESINRIKDDLLILPMAKGMKQSPIALPKNLATLVAHVIRSREFQGNTNEVLVLHAATGTIRRLVLVGVGEAKTLTAHILGRAIGAGIMRVKKSTARAARVILAPDLVRTLPHEALIETIALDVRQAHYHFGKYKRKAENAPHGIRSLTIALERPTPALDAVLARAMVIADAVQATRDLGNTDAVEVTPAFLADRARAIAKEHRAITVRVLAKKDLEREKLGGILAVGKGSIHDPCLIVMEYNGADKKTPPVALVGKAITFDSGGISLKPWQNMHEMKYDMLGGASVMSIMTALARLKVPVNVVGFVAAAENMPSHTAYKPGDVVVMGDGTTVEIITTDAEGRMVVADAVIYSRRYKPPLVIDIATLTGAMIVALGDYATGLFTNDDALAEHLTAAGKTTGDLVWRMPLVPEWVEGLKSTIADLRNISVPKSADATIGGLFIEQFIKKPTRFAHLDIAGTAWRSSGSAFMEQGATGASIPLLVTYLEKIRKT